MNATEVLELIRAGYTKDEINTLFGTGENPTETPSGADKEEPETAAETETEQPPQPAQGQNDERIASLEQAITKLTEQLQRSNINNRGVETVPAMTAEQALGSLITKKG